MGLPTREPSTLETSRLSLALCCISADAMLLLGCTEFRKHTDVLDFEARIRLTSAVHCLQKGGWVMIASATKHQSCD